MPDEKNPNENSTEYDPWHEQSLFDTNETTHAAPNAQTIGGDASSRLTGAKTGKRGFGTASNADGPDDGSQTRFEEANDALTPEHRAYWQSRGIAPATAITYGVRSEGKTIVFRYIVKQKIWNEKLRHGKGNMPWRHSGRLLRLWNLDCLAPDLAPDESLIITEGEPDALSCLEAGFSRVVSLPNGAQAGEKAHTYLYTDDDQEAELLPDLAKFQDVVIAVDNDSKGKKCCADLVRRLGHLRVRIATYPSGCKDANDVLRIHGVERLRQCIGDADHIGRRCIVSMCEVPEPPPVSAYKTGIYGLDAHGFNVITPSLVAVMGPYGSGKSIFVRQLLKSLHVTHQWPWLYSALEEKPKPRLAHANRCLYSAGAVDFSDPKAVREIDELYKQCKFLIRDPAIDATPQWFMNLCEITIKRYGVKVICLDPYNDLDHMRDMRETETEYAARFIYDLKRLAEAWDVLMIVTLHPNKMATEKRNNKKQIMSLADVSGSMHWGNKADVGICMWRPFENGPSMMHIDKLKDERVMGRRTLAKCALDEATESFVVVPISYADWRKKGEDEE